jgi:hypothetical protein
VFNTIITIASERHLTPPGEAELEPLELDWQGVDPRLAALPGVDPAGLSDPELEVRRQEVG